MKRYIEMYGPPVMTAIAARDRRNDYSSQLIESLFSNGLEEPGTGFEPVLSRSAAGRLDRSATPAINSLVGKVFYLRFPSFPDVH